ncbi:MAG: hypothetical protein JWP32_2955 [Schumannella sp.]|nr:hypothetical protein [Schumannella sp.]
MIANMPSYNWESHDALTARIQILDKLLLGFQKRQRPGNAGSEHILTFLKLHGLVRLDDTALRPHVDIERLSQKMLRDAFNFSDQCAVRAHNIVGYVENICRQFNGGSYADKIDGEVSMRQLDLNIIQDHIRVVGAVYGPKEMPYYDRTFHEARVSDVHLAQFYYQDLTQNQRAGYDVRTTATGLSPIFNLAGRQVALAMLTQRYSSAAIALSDDVAILLGTAALSPTGSRLEMRHKELHGMANDLLLGALFALDEAAQLARESYRSLEIGRPVFRAEPEIPFTRQFPGSRQP